MQSTLVKNADRMMLSATARAEGIELSFADGRGGLVPYAEISEGLTVASLELPNPYELILTAESGQRMELPWDFARHYCDESYQVRVESLALAGRQALGQRIRHHRKAAGLTQDALALTAGVGRATVIRLEKGERIPRFKTLTALATALHQDVQELLTGTN